MKKNSHKIALYVVFGSVLFLGWCYLGLVLGGALFFHLTSLDLSQLDVTSLFRYWDAYGDREDVQKFLVPSSALSALFIAVPGIVAVIVNMPKEQEIHGSARFANDKEIKESLKSLYLQLK